MGKARKAAQEKGGRLATTVYLPAERDAHLRFLAGEGSVSKLAGKIVTDYLDANPLTAEQRKKLESMPPAPKKRTAVTPAAQTADAATPPCPLGCPGDPAIGCDHCYNPHDPCDCRACLPQPVQPQPPQAPAAPVSAMLDGF